MKIWKTQIKTFHFAPFFHADFFFLLLVQPNNKKNKQKENSNDENWMENWTWKIENMVNFPRKANQQQNCVEYSLAVDAS